jgi:hypothetical protein
LILGGKSCAPIEFQAKAFDQLVLEAEKKELIRAVARNAGAADNQSEEKIS